MCRAIIPSILYPDPVSFGQYDKFEICTVSNVIKEEMCKDCPPGLIPIYTIGDGNCLFRAISKVIYGHENCHVEIRVQSVIELALNADSYLNKDFISKHFEHVDDSSMTYIMTVSLPGVSLHKEDFNLETVFQNEVMKYTSCGVYGSLLHILSLVNVYSNSCAIIIPRY